MSEEPRGVGPAERLGSLELAELIVDALLRANILRQQDVERALMVTAEEIDARKSVGDY